MSPIRALNQYGQSVWLGYINRSSITGGGRQRLIDEDGLTGVTSNPAIFTQAGGIAACGSSFDQLLTTVEHKRRAIATAAG